MATSARKILQALYYIQENAPKANNSRQNIMYLLKLLYFADRYHIRHFGFLASGDTYYAMARGPVASLACDILKNVTTHINSAEVGLLTSIKNISEYEVEISKQQDDELSESFKEAIDFSIKTFGKLNNWKLSEITHDYPEWKKLKKIITKKNRAEISLIDFFDNPKELIYLNKNNINKDPYEEDKKFLTAMKADFCETSV